MLPEERVARAARGHWIRCRLVVRSVRNKRSESPVSKNGGCSVKRSMELREPSMENLDLRQRHVGPLPGIGR